MVVDGVSNDTSSRRQAKLDNQKTPDQLRLEEPRCVAGLLSLCGAGAVVVNLWANSFQAATYVASQTLAKCRDGQPIAQSARGVLHEPFDPAADAAGSASGAKGKAAKGKAAKGKPADDEEDAPPARYFKHRVRCCTVVYGLPDVGLQ